MARRGFLTRFVAGLVTRLSGNRHGNSHLSDGDWTLLETPRTHKPQRSGEPGQWTEDNLS